MKNLIDYISEELNKIDNLPNLFLVDNEDLEDIKRVFGHKTIYGNTNFTSNVKSLATAQTIYIDKDNTWTNFYTQKKKDIFDNVGNTLFKVFEYLNKCPLLLCQGRICHNDEFNIHSDLYLSYYKKEASHLACMFKDMTFDLRGDENHHLKVICIPEWNEKERQVIVIPELNITFILGSDYFEEIKNACLRISISIAKSKNILPVHAASKIVTFTENNKEIKTGIVIFGISSTGKTTHILHDHGFKGKGEKVQILQDDLLFLTNHSILGSERGFYIRTDSLSESNQPLLYNATKMPDVILENVMVDFQGNIYFDNKNLTGNSHAVIKRELLEHTDTSINIPNIDDLDNLIFIFMAKNFTCVPIVSKLTKEQAAACYMLSEPFDAMASEFSKCDGKSSLASMPFGVGNNVSDVNLFYNNLLKYKDKIKCYMINNGGVGELSETSIDGSRKIRKKVNRVSIPEISMVIKALIKEQITWKEDKNWQLLIPENIDGMNINKYDLYNYYTQDKIDLLISQIRSERRAFADNYKGLNEKINNNIEF